jgi:hypothetical protein
MEKVREALALAWPDNHVEDDEFIDALSEVEQWEARLAEAEGMLTLKKAPKPVVENEEMTLLEQVVARAEAAEAEADKWNEIAFVAMAEADILKAALQYALDSMESPDTEYAPGKDIYDSHMIRGAIVRARAALVPADPNTT